jgi:hypothetical protein
MIGNVKSFVRRTPTASRSTRYALVAVGVVVAVAVAATAAADGAKTVPAAFRLVFEGKHTPELLHEGTFTTAASFCPSGSAADTSIDSNTETAVRTFRCSGSADAFTARVKPLPAEHGGSGSWQIVSGSGALADLRGKGTWTSVRLGGTTDDPATITFRSTWEGVTDYDASAPTIALSRSSAQRLRRPKGAYLVRFRLSFSEAAGNVVTYDVRVIDPRNAHEVPKVGSTSTGTASFAIHVRPTRRTRILTIKVEATDPVGNAAHLATKLRIR